MLPTKHHYIPEFYLRYWVGDDGRFIRYDRPNPTKIAARRAFPSEAGWVRDLYKSPGDQNGDQWLEIDIFQVVDSRAAPALRKMVAEPVEHLSTAERSAWTVFVRSLFHRTPENFSGTINSAIKVYEESLESARERYPELRSETNPPTFDEYKASLTTAQIRRSALSSIPTLLTNPVIGQFMHDMPTRIFTLPMDANDFLLSDDPMARTNGLNTKGGHFALPISPRKLFVSASETETLDQIAAMKPSEISRAMNKSTVEGARFFVVSRDISQDRFIRNRFGQQPRTPILG